MLMTDKRKRWVIYYDEDLQTRVDRLRLEAAKKDGVPVKRISVRRVIADAVGEKYVEYVDKQNNRARITTIVETLVSLIEVNVDLVTEHKELTLAVQELILLTKGANHEQSINHRW